MRLAESILLLAYLLLMTINDVKKREISTGCSVITAVLLIAGEVFCVYQGEISWYIPVAGILPGIFLLWLSWFSKWQIGIGDGIVFVISGIFLGFFDNLVLLFWALLLAGTGSGIMVLCKKMKRSDVIPFVPFIFAGYGVIWLWTMLQ